MKCTWITECYYPESEYNRFNPFERRKVYINQQLQKKQAGNRSSDNEELFTSSDDNDVDANRGNAALARGTLKRRNKS